jgi:7-cyano-7-deazaguanine reductase
VYAYAAPDNKLLEHFPSPFDENTEHTVLIEAPEFTSLCPKTGQPDFATIVVEYVPNDRCVESKSFKLYLGSFRMHGEFHEACVARIANDLINLLHPAYIRVVGQFTPRGGIKFWPTVEWSE